MYKKRVINIILCIFLGDVAVITDYDAIPAYIPVIKYIVILQYKVILGDLQFTFIFLFFN